MDPLWRGGFAVQASVGMCGAGPEAAETVTTASEIRGASQCQSALRKGSDGNRHPSVPSRTPSVPACVLHTSLLAHHSTQILLAALVPGCASHRLVPGAGLWLFTLTSGGVVLVKGSGRVLSDGERYFYPCFLRACLFVLLLGKQPRSCGISPRRGAGGSLPVPSLTGSLSAQLSSKLGPEEDQQELLWYGVALVSSPALLWVTTGLCGTRN